jgi:hypothetical protein
MQSDVAQRPAESVAAPVLSPADEPETAQPAQAGRSRASLRLRGALLLVPCAAVLCVAVWLTPRSAGYGTHQQLGLPPCSFLSRTGYPCPSCGLTSSFAAMAHGRIAEALRDHPFGPPLVLAVAAIGLCGLAELVSGRDVVLRLLRPGAWWAVVAATGLLAGWGIKIALGLAHGTLPVR